MKLYAICWQDSMEPWGWAPLEPDETEDGASVFYWSKVDALRDLKKVVRRAAERYLRDTYHTPTPETAEEWASREHSVQEYDVPKPPSQVRLTW